MDTLTWLILGSFTLSIALGVKVTLLLRKAHQMLSNQKVLLSTLHEVHSDLCKIHQLSAPDTPEFPSVDAPTQILELVEGALRKIATEGGIAAVV